MTATRSPTFEARRQRRGGDHARRRGARRRSTRRRCAGSGVAPATRAVVSGLRRAASRQDRGHRGVEDGLGVVGLPDRPRPDTVDPSVRGTRRGWRGNGGSGSPGSGPGSRRAPAADSRPLLDTGQGGGVLVEDAAEVAELGGVGPPFARGRGAGSARRAVGGPSAGTGSSNMTSMTAAGGRRRGAGTGRRAAWCSPPRARSWGRRSTRWRRGPRSRRSRSSRPRSSRPAVDGSGRPGPGGRWHRRGPRRRRPG